MGDTQTVDLDDILRASSRIKHQVIQTPFFESKLLSARIKGRVFFKAENLQHTSSFKFRGASNAILSLSESKDTSRVVAYSSGNHAQAVACAAQIEGFHATIVMPKDAPAIKIYNTRQYEAKVVLYDRYKESREEIGEEIVQKTGAALIKPYDDLRVIAGQGTTGLETSKQAKAIDIRPDAMIVCCGGGGLTAGCGIAMKSAFPDIAMFTAEPEHFDDYARSLKTGKRQLNDPKARSICDAIVTPTPGQLTFPIASQLYRGGLVANDEQVKKAIKFLFEKHRLVAEPGGAIAVAALMGSPERFNGQTVVATISGGNIDPEFLWNILKEA